MIVSLIIDDIPSKYFWPPFRYQNINLWVSFFVAGNEYEHDDYSLSDSYSIVYRSLLKMGLNNTPKNLRKRITFFSVLFGGMVTYYLWEAMLISYFSSPKTSLPFDSLQGFLTHSDKKVIFLECSNEIIYSIKNQLMIYCIVIIFFWSNMWNISHHMFAIIFEAHAS